MRNQFVKMFDSCQDANEIKKLYKGLAMANHPDRGGDEETMKLINIAYFSALEEISNHPRTAPRFTPDSEREYKYNFNMELEKEILDQFYKVWNLTGLTVEILGLWIWVSGDTKPHKEAIKEAGYMFSSTKTAWYWHKGKYSGSRGGVSLDAIRDNYGISKDNRKSKTQYYPSYAGATL